ncbi:STAS domain-containing protein [Methylicorpusculum sp.]|uniref:STAS domain-containing protein n=1 Tax=Methylicorpusculum sp. TaxID=2713644 RepID=UPI002730DFAA|nr:STAS domain-containing protein [Methylicorpusculum sp.]MDP2177982.1 STAS domain-containing protein [Methylicorpusculum sp.]MDP3528131.1 STAS domain-containing protein [Methylicorpusculum sp.]MDZ4151382.1 STAS domain-containing protein [Methylicorpusculum sp.]
MSVSSQYNKDKKELVIRVTGRFDFSLHQDFRKVSDMDKQAIDRIIIDLSRTDYLDSSALGMLLVLREKINNNKNAIHLIHAKPEVKKIFQIANFDQLFTIN